MQPTATKRQTFCDFHVPKIDLKHNIWLYFLKDVLYLYTYITCIRFLGITDYEYLLISGLFGWKNIHKLSRKQKIWISDVVNIYINIKRVKHQQATTLRLFLIWNTLHIFFKLYTHFIIFCIFLSCFYTIYSHFI